MRETGTGILSKTRKKEEERYSYLRSDLRGLTMGVM